MILDIAIIVFLIIAAIILILVEIFLLPGITFAGVGGALFAIGGIIFAYSVSIMAGHITLIASVVAFVVIFAWLLRSHSFSHVALKADVDSRVTSTRDLGIKIGDEGITLSRLAPIGKARFHQIRVEAKSECGFIDENVPVTVIQINGYDVVVRPTDHSQES